MSCRTVPLILVFLALAGCGQSTGLFSVSSKIKDPVAPPPPKRTALANTEADPAGDAGTAGDTALQRPILSESPVRSAAGEVAGDSLMSRLAGQTPQTLLLARAGGEPIFLSDVLEAVGPELASDRTRLPSEQIRAAQEQRVRQGLQTLVERQLLLQQVARELKEQQLKMLHQEADKEFQKRMRDLMRQLGVSTETELAARLAKDGMSLAKLRQSHQDNYVSHQFLQSKIGASATVSRRDLLDYYQSNIDDYTDTARVTWQHLSIAQAPDHRSGQASRCACDGCRQARRLHAQLAAGADFDALARQHSQGPRKDDGGHWDWTPKGSLADPVLDAALFSLAPGPVSPILEGSDGLHIVRVLQRETGGAKSFRAVQGEIRDKVRQQKITEAAKKYLDQLRESADVEYVLPGLQPADAL